MWNVNNVLQVFDVEFEFSIQEIPGLYTTAPPFGGLAILLKDSTNSMKLPDQLELDGCRTTPTIPLRPHDEQTVQINYGKIAFEFNDLAP